MTVEVNIGEPENKKEESSSEDSIKMNLRARTTLDGAVMITDHFIIDVVVYPDTKKVTAFPKKSYTDEVYATQNRFFEHMMKSGIVDRESVQTGAVHGSLEGLILQPKDGQVPVMELTLLNVGKFIEKEKPEYIFQSVYDHEVDDLYVEPSEEDSTELGEVPQEANKGSIQPYFVRRYLGSGF